MTISRKVWLYNTLSREKEEFKPMAAGQVSMYTCGPTVYHFAHLGNLRTYIFEDVLRKTLIEAGYQVKHVMNITDVGHLQSDADVGDDKMMLAAKREQKSPWDIARYYEKRFFHDCKLLNIAPPTITARATEHIGEMIQFVEKLEKAGAAYNVDNNIYFDISTFKKYPEFARLKLNKSEQKLDDHEHKENNYSRIEADSRKRNPQDFVLWFSQSKYPDQIMKWNSPWGMGFPGWHIECSAMAVTHLGHKIDIHCGGEDHIPVHHTNEIAQTESLTGEKWVNYWLHGAFLVDKHGKMSKSTGGFMTVERLVDAGFRPEHFRYFCLQGNYRKPLKFSFELLEEARNEFEKMKLAIISLKNTIAENAKAESVFIATSVGVAEKYQADFLDALCDDLNTNKALKIFTKALADRRMTPHHKLSLLQDCDKVFGLGVMKFHAPTLGSHITTLLQVRSLMRQRGFYAEADKLRDVFQEANLVLEDRNNGSSAWIIKRPLYFPPAVAESQTSIRSRRRSSSGVAVSQTSISSSSSITTAAVAVAAGNHAESSAEAITRVPQHLTETEEFVVVENVSTSSTAMPVPSVAPLLQAAIGEGAKDRETASPSCFLSGGLIHGMFGAMCSYGMTLFNQLHRNARIPLVSDTQTKTIKRI